MQKSIVYRPASGFRPLATAWESSGAGVGRGAKVCGRKSWLCTITLQAFVEAINCSIYCSCSMEACNACPKDCRTPRADEQESH